MPSSEVQIRDMGGGVKLPAMDMRQSSSINAVLPRNIDEAYRLAQAIVAAGLAPDSYKNDKNDAKADPQKVMIGILKGMEVGLPPITALGTIAIINGRPCLWGDGAVALIQASGMLAGMTCEQIGERINDRVDIDAFPDDFGVEVKMWRRGQSDPYVGRFTVRDAKRAHLWGNPKRAPWMLYPQRMLKWRAVSWPMRDGFADCLCGLSIREEVEDMAPPPAPPAADFLDDDGPAAIEHHETVDDLATISEEERDVVTDDDWLPGDPGGNGGSAA